MKGINIDLDEAQRHPEGQMFPSDHPAIVAVMRERERVLREAKGYKEEIIFTAKSFYEKLQELNSAIKRYNQCSRAIAKLEDKTYYNTIDAIQPDRFIPFLNGEDNVHAAIKNGPGDDPQQGLDQNFGGTVDVSQQDLADLLREATSLLDSSNTTGWTSGGVLFGCDLDKGLSEELSHGGSKTGGSK